MADKFNGKSIIFTYTIMCKKIPSQKTKKSVAEQKKQMSFTTFFHVLFILKKIISDFFLTLK